MNRIILISVLAVTAACVWYGLRSSTQPPPSPGAAPVEAARRIVAEGRVTAYPDAETTLSSEILGTIVRIAVEEGAHVTAGTVLVELNGAELRAQIDEANAACAERQAEVDYAAWSDSRQDQLGASGAAAAVERERARRELAVATARCDRARAEIRRLEAQSAKTRIVAPIDGVVVARMVNRGETVSPGTRMLTVCDLAKRRIEAEIDEYALNDLKIGMSVSISAEGHGNARWRGHIEALPDAVATPLASGRSWPPDRHARAAGEDRVG
jgi:HlyD family secretion protein